MVRDEGGMSIAGINPGPTDVTIAVVGDGFGALMVYTTSIYVGFDLERIGIFGESTNPVGTYQQFAWNLGQTVLRSESGFGLCPGPGGGPRGRGSARRTRRAPGPGLRAPRLEGMVDARVKHQTSVAAFALLAIVGLAVPIYFGAVQ